MSLSGSEGSLEDPIMFDLFCVEIETQCRALNQGLVEIEQRPKDQKLLEPLMRAAHSIKGAARVVNLDSLVRLAHAMEDCFVFFQTSHIDIPIEKIDQLLRSVDLMAHIPKIGIKNIHTWLAEQLSLINKLIEELTFKVESSTSQKSIKKLTKVEGKNLSSLLEENLKEIKGIENKKELVKNFNRDRVLRITAENLNRLMGLAGESLVESRWLYPFADHLQEFKYKFAKIEKLIDILRDHLEGTQLNETAQRCLKDLYSHVHALHSQFNEHLVDFDYFIRRNAHLSDRLHQEVINSRMRPFADGIEIFPRMVRDLARQLGKQVKLEISGKATPVDRDILEKLESPLSHLLRNAIDHGIESPEERLVAHKCSEGSIKMEAHQRGGKLVITLSDDGRGIDIKDLRLKIVERKLTSEEIANRLTDAEVIDFLFLPGFSTSKNLTEISGRGVGLNIVQNTIQEVGGVVRVQSISGKGTRFHLQLPLTLSVIRALLVEISGEAYAFPLAQVEQAFLVLKEDIQIIENRYFFHYRGDNIGLVPAWEVLGLDEPQMILESLPIVILKENMDSYGVVVDRFIGEKELVVQELDSRLGKIPDIHAGALMEDGLPILIVDVEDMIRSISYLISGGRLTKVAYSKEKRASTFEKTYFSSRRFYYCSRSRMSIVA